MFTQIRKRDERIVAFDPGKITDAIFAAAKAVGGEDRQLALVLTVEVMNLLKQEYQGEIFSVEEVQDAVEKVLINTGHARTAKAYILYREKRSRLREARTELMDAVAEILQETNRDNANVGNSPSAKVLQISEAASKNYYLKRVLPEDEALAHREGDIYIHDLGWYGKTMTCLQIPLDKLLREGFNNGHGYIRPPKGIKTAAALAAIILQSNQNDMHGGQSFAYFDRDLAPYVELEYQRQEKKLRDAVEQLGLTVEEKQLKEMALEYTEEEVYQAMEGFVYNLNTMHSLSGKERIWVYDKVEEKFFTISMEDFHQKYMKGRYQALSLNYQNGCTELKEITGTFQHKNIHKLFTIKLKSGQKVTVTDNHSVMALGGEGEIKTETPHNLKHCLVPRELGVYSKEITLSGEKAEKLEETIEVLGEQTPYDYEFLRALIKDVYGVFCRNSFNYQITPAYLEKIAGDLASRILEDEEKIQIERLSSKDYWLDQLVEVLPQIKTSARYYLLKILAEKELPRYCKRLPVFYPYKDMLQRFYLPENVNLDTASRIDNHCQSPALVMEWACRILEQNQKFVNLLETIIKVLRLWPIKVKELVEEAPEEYVYDISVADNENFLAAEGIFVHNSRAGAQVPFSSINLGTDTSWAGRMINKNFLLAFEKGLGKGEAPLFPNVIFKIKEGVNYEEEDPNYDLFKLSLRVACKRLQPNFSYQDASFNAPHREEEVAYMGCRTRVIANVNGPAVTNRRGNLSFTTINLPRLGIRSGGDLTLFWQYLDEVIDLTIKQLLTRYDLQKKLRIRDFPFLMGQKLYLDSEDLKPDDSVEKAIRHGTLSVGFIGLAECLIALTGKHHGESPEAQALGLAIVSYLRRRCDEATRQYGLNFTLLATPAEQLSGKFTKLDLGRFGVVPGITDKEWYTNSFHVPVEYEIPGMEKIALEGPYHKYCNAGHISYVELPSAPHQNLEAFETIIRAMCEADMGYFAVNFPVDICKGCGFNGVIETETCPKCHTEGQISRIRRITGYLSTLDKFNDSKLAEERNRKIHLKFGG
jgi:anaerobic ribonucleoside-triphosphate reductase